MKTVISKRWTINLPKFRSVGLDWDNWEKERLDALHKNIRDGDVLLDIGSEQGDLPCLFSMWGANVFLVEPNPLFWPGIRHIFELNKQEPLGGFAGFASNSEVSASDLLEDPFKLEARGVWPGCAYEKKVVSHDFRNVLERYHDTPQTKIDSLNLQPDIINIDIEGAELEALRGAEQTLRKYKPLVFVSVHPEFMLNDYGYNEHDLYEWMELLGYEKELLAVDHEHHYAFWHPEGNEYIR